MIVLDASAAVDFLLAIGASDRIERRVSLPDETLHAPHLLDVEVARALRRLTLRGDVTASRAADALDDLADLRVTRYPHGPLLRRAWQLRPSVSMFDAVYIALAEALEAALITSDAKLARSPGHSATVEVYGS